MNCTFKAACLFPFFGYRDIFIKKEKEIVPFVADSLEDANKKLLENQKNLMVFIDEGSPKHIFNMNVRPGWDDIIIYTLFKKKNLNTPGISV